MYHIPVYTSSSSCFVSPVLSLSFKSAGFRPSGELFISTLTGLHIPSVTGSINFLSMSLPSISPYLYIPSVATPQNPLFVLFVFGKFSLKCLLISPHLNHSFKTIADLDGGVEGHFILAQNLQWFPIIGRIQTRCFHLAWPFRVTLSSVSTTISSPATCSWPILGSSVFPR